MPSIVEVRQSHLQGLARKSEIFDSLLVLMQEAAQRVDSVEAVRVASCILVDLSEDYPELEATAKSWSTLARIEQKRYVDTNKTDK